MTHTHSKVDLPTTTLNLNTFLVGKPTLRYSIDIKK